MNIRCHFGWFRFFDTFTIIILRYGSANRPNLLVQSNTQDVMSTSATRHRLKLKRKLSLHSKLTGNRREDLVKWERSHDQLEEYYLQVYAGYTVDAHTYCTATIIAYNRGRTPTVLSHDSFDPKRNTLLPHSTTHIAHQTFDTKTTLRKTLNHSLKSETIKMHAARDVGADVRVTWRPKRRRRRDVTSRAQRTRPTDLPLTTPVSISTHVH